MLESYPLQIGIISVRQKAIAYLLCSLLLGLIISAPIESVGQSKVKRYEPSKTAEPVPGQPYEKFSTRDRFGREIIFYLSKTIVSKNPLPLVVYIEGSGCGSRFEEGSGANSRGRAHECLTCLTSYREHCFPHGRYSRSFANYYR